MTARITSTDDSAVVSGARVQIPAWGRWWADVVTATPISIAVGEVVTITIGDATLSGAVVSGGASHGRGAYRVVAGAGGWSNSVSAKGYHNGGGVAISSILSDAASEVGESLGSAPSGRVDEHYARTAGPASRLLNALAPRAWYVDLAGVTQFGARTTSTYGGAATRVDVLPARDCVELVTDAIANILPGVTVDALEAATDVEYVLTSTRLSVRVYGGPRSSRELDAFRRVYDSIDPLRAYRVAYDYRVVTQSGDALNLQPVRSSTGMPDLESVPVRLAPGVKAMHFPGSVVTVMFRDGDPSRPFVISGDASGEPGWMPLFLMLGDEPTLGVARMTDPVIAGPFGGTIISGSIRVKAGM